jgi:hypothetical protein
MNPSDIGGRPAPWPNAYRVPGEYVLAGEYPGPLHQADQVRDRLHRLLDEGVRAFVDLTQEVDGLDPYIGLLADVAAERGVDVVHHPLGIPDMDVPTPAHMQQVLDTVDAELARGHGVYVHCWGGIGRTGTVVGCLLVRRGLEAEQALHNVQAAYATMAKVTRHPASPQTTAQRRFVRDWALHEARAHALPLREHLRLVQPRAALLAAHPPRFVHPHKQRIAARLLAAPAPAGDVGVTRWSLEALPVQLPPRWPTVVLREGFFRYDPADETPGTMHWQLNFADTHLFGFYAGDLLAQDELQVLEHPVLGAVREWLLADGHAAYTMEGGEPTPVLVTGAERRAR